jgi:hypothetical protein
MEFRVKMIPACHFSSSIGYLVIARPFGDKHN